MTYPNRRRWLLTTYHQTQTTVGEHRPGLSDRLATDGGSAEEWAQLIGALGVLGRTNQAFAIYKNAETVFADDPSGLDLVTRAAQRAGVAE